MSQDKCQTKKVEQKTYPGEIFPEMKVSDSEGNIIELGCRTRSENWKVIVVYRGAHCPMCTDYLKTLESLYGEFTKSDVDVVAVSADGVEKTRIRIIDANLTFPVYCGLSENQMARLGLFVSDPENAGDIDFPFPEPGIFIINPAGRLHIVDISNAPYLRPDLKKLLDTINYIKLPGDKRYDEFGGNYYPTRGCRKI